MAAQKETPKEELYVLVPRSALLLSTLSLVASRLWSYIVHSILAPFTWALGPVKITVIVLLQCKEESASGIRGSREAPL